MKNLILAATLLFAAPLLAADDIVALYSAYEKPTLGASKLAENITFTSGHLKVTLAQGSAAPVMAGEETIGVFFKGKGQLEYVSDDPAEAAVLSTNARKAKMKVEKVANGLAVRDSFEELFLRAGGRELPALTGAAGTDLTAAFAEHLGTMNNDQRAPGAFELIKQKLDAPARPVVRAQFRGGKEILLYSFDSIETKRETLTLLQQLAGITVKELKNALWPVELSSLPIGVSRKDFLEPPYILVNLQYTVTASEDRNASLQIVETLVPRGSAQRVFRFDQNSTVYDSNEKVRRYHVRKVTTEAGQPVSFIHDRDELLVGLPAAAPADKPFKLTFEIDGDFLIRPNNSSYWRLAGNWFPQPDLNGQYYRIQSTIKVKKPFVPFASGDTVARREEGDYNVVENKIDKPVSYAVALAGRYLYEEETRNGLTIRVASYAGKNTRAAKELTNLAFNMIALYEKFLGPFPFKEYNIIEVNSHGWGQAPPAMMFITQEAFNPTLGWTNRLYSQGVNHMFAHEIAHQYWGYVAKMSTYEEQWIEEAFSEYSASILLRAAKGDDLLTPTWRANAKEATGTSSIATANQLEDLLDPGTAFLMRTYLIYSKGAYLLSRLHAELGDKHFLTFLRTVQGKYAWRHVSTKELVAVLKDVTGKDYTAYFDEHYWGTGMPK
jgi:hypothetical protein